MAKDVNIDSELLISLVESNPVIWDKTLDTYKTRVATKIAWYKILPVLIPDFKSRDEREKKALLKVIIQKWTHIRDSYFKSIRKSQEQKIAKGLKIAKPFKLQQVPKPYLYSKRLYFLQKVMNPNLLSGINDDDNDNDSRSRESTELDDTNENNTEPSVSSNAELKHPKKPLEKQISPIDAKMMKFMESFTSAQGSKPINRHISFFTGILPTLDDFDEDEVLEFQMGVLKLMKSIKRNRLQDDVNTLPTNIQLFNTLSNPLKMMVEED